ncbi:MAG: glutamate--tRNA ligase [Bdellovibrionales bacterium]
MTQEKQQSNNKSSINKPVRVRFAPSPTGYLHVGGARTAFYNYIFAKKHNGTFILRVEDTDEARSTKESLISMIDDMKWLGLKWQEGPQDAELNSLGDKGPYLQSERKAIYKEYVQKLLDLGKAYYCFLTEEELDVQRAEAKAAKKPFRPLSPYRDWPVEKALEKIAGGETAAVRFRNDYGDTPFTFTDLVRGEVSLPSSMIGDFVIARSTGVPVYNFVCAMDDALMEITHVFRAEEHLNNTLRQLMIMEAFGFDRPTYGHMSIMLGEDKQKLSKRHGAASVGEFKEGGYLPEALTNFIALMGWSSPSGEEILSFDTMVKEFSDDRLNPASAVFDKEKLKWMNAQYLRALSPKEFWSHMTGYLDSSWKFPEGEEWVSKACNALKTSMTTFIDGVELFSMLRLGDDLSLDDKAKDVLTWDSTKTVLKVWIEALTQTDKEYFDTDDVDTFTALVKEKAEVKGKHLFMPLRVASIGRAHGTEIKDLIPLIPKGELIRRAETLL